MKSLLRVRCLAVLVALSAGAAPALAQDPGQEGGAAKASDGPSAEDMAKAKQAFMEGKQYFDAGELRKAAIAFKNSYKLSKNPILLYNVGFTIDKMGKIDLAIFYYDKFLTDAPESAPNRDTVTKRLAELKALQAQKKADEEAAAKKAASEASESRSGASEGGELQHNVVEEAPPGKPLDITAFAPENAGWIVTLYYRLPGVSNYTEVVMKPRYAELVGRIPARVTAKVTSIQYYVEARAGKQLVARSGEPTSPHLITISKSAPARFYPDFDDGSGLVGPTTGPTDDQNDVQHSKYFWYKWGTTGGTVGMLILTASFYAISSDAASTLEGEARASTVTDACPDKPCRAYSPVQKSLADRGKTFETLGHVTLGLSVAAAVAAGYFWYADMKHGDHDDDGSHGGYDPDSDSPVSRIDVAPIFDDTFFGGAARIEF